jgi:competence CoiA-like predicted nuclease
MTAQHASAGALDATLPDVGAGISWETVHRARPRAPLTCRGCGGPVHAKVSRGGQQFFAHDARPEHCHLLGEGLAHRLLKSALASAARQAGWTAELEAAGDGWRADVLTTSPNGERRVAWEAQLAPITPDEVGDATTR